MVGGWISETLSILVSPLNALADAIQWVANAIGSELQSMGRNLSDWFAGIRDGLGNLGDSIGGFFTTISSSLGDWFGDVGRWFSDLGRSIGGFFSELGRSIGGWFSDLIDNVLDIFKSIGKLLDYINPFSENNFLRILFVPSDDYFESYSSTFKTALSNKFPIFPQLFDTWESVKGAVSDRVNGWDGFTVDMSRYGAGTLTVVDPTFVNAIAPKMRFWIGAFLYFMTFLFIIKRSSQLIGAGR